MKLSGGVFWHKHVLRILFFDIIFSFYRGKKKKEKLSGGQKWHMSRLQMRAPSFTHRQAEIELDYWRKGRKPNIPHFLRVVHLNSSTQTPYRFEFLPVDLAAVKKHRSNCVACPCSLHRSRGHIQEVLSSTSTKRKLVDHKRQSFLIPRGENKEETLVGFSFFMLAGRMWKRGKYKWDCFHKAT